MLIGVMIRQEELEDYICSLPNYGYPISIVKKIPSDAIEYEDGYWKDNKILFPQAKAEEQYLEYLREVFADIEHEELKLMVRG